MADIPDLWWSPTAGVVQKLESGWRVMADLRDQAAAAESDRDAARSDREELRSERDVLTYELEDAQQHARNVAAQRDVEHRAFVEAAAERDALQARLDEIRTVLAEDAATRARFQVDTSTSYGPRFLSRIRAIVERAALQGDQPAEPKCICRKFVDTGGFRLADLCCPVHGVNGTEPGDGPDDRCHHGRPAPCPECTGLVEPTVTPPDPSGRIVNGGPIQPFTDTDG